MCAGSMTISFFNSGEVWPFKNMENLLVIWKQSKTYFIIFICKNLQSYSDRESTY